MIFIIIIYFFLSCRKHEVDNKFNFFSNTQMNLKILIIKKHLKKNLILILR